MDTGLLYKDEAYAIVGCCMEVHRILGKGFAEILYKDALQCELLSGGIPFEREKAFDVVYKGHVLPHKYCADFVLFQKIILEVKANVSLTNSHKKQTLNYLAASKLRLGLLVNFGEDSLKYQRIIL